jgi:hypothetical protein
VLGVEVTSANSVMEVNPSKSYDGLGGASQGGTSREQEQTLNSGG